MFARNGVGTAFQPLIGNITIIAASWAGIFFKLVHHPTAYFLAGLVVGLKIGDSFFDFRGSNVKSIKRGSWIGGVNDQLWIVFNKICKEFFDFLLVGVTLEVKRNLIDEA